MRVTIDTGGTPINLFDITISYPKNRFAFTGYAEKETLKKTWLTTPLETEEGIHFTGIISGGAEGVYVPDTSKMQSLPVVTLLFTPLRTGESVFAVSHSELLKNDGKGTVLTHQTNTVTVTASLPSTLDTTEVTKDTISPDPFTISFIPADRSSSTPSLVTFFATDSGSGIARYQLQYGTDAWKDVQSPLEISKGIFRKIITIRAVDFSGNTRESHTEIPGYISLTLLLIVCIIGIIWYCLVFILKRKR